MSKRHRDADGVWYGGASNPRAVARALVSAIDEAVEEGGGSDSAADPAVQMILDHLCFLCGMPQPSLGMDAVKWDEILNSVEALK